MQHSFSIDGVRHSLWLARGRRNYELRLEGEVIPIALDHQGGARYTLTLDGRVETVFLAIDNDDIHIHLGGTTYVLRYNDPVNSSAGEQNAVAPDIARAPMPGTVLTVRVAPGQAVTTGDALVVIESMKLETTVRAWRDGKVAAIHVSEGQSFERDAALLTLAPVGE
jgi:acetyl/propionyl-CoA carboxylase alpha subunit